MDEAEEERTQLLESIRLQDAALSVTVDNTILTLESDSDDNDEDISVTVCPPCNTQADTFSGDSPGIKKQPSWAEALEANQDYDEVLAQLETEIRQNIAKVNRQIEVVQSKITTESNVRSAVNMKSHWIYVFGMPYFKTANLYPCPHNEDYHRKKRNNEICWSDLPSFHQWIGRHKKALNQAVRKLSLEKCDEEARLKLAVMRKDLDFAKEQGNIEKVEQLEEDIKNFDVKEYALSLVDGVVENGEHDWMQISAKFLEGKQSPETCKSFWYLYLHPKINKSPYTEAEESKLISLVEKHNHEDWDKIAEELGTNRSGYQCFIVYQNKLNSTLKKNVWSPEEDKKLAQVVEMCRMRDYIPWGKVSYHMEGRTKTQVFNRWTYSVNPAIKKGRFTQDEDIMILVGVQMWGEDFQRISKFLTDRTTSQVRHRYKHHLNRPGMGVPWTMEDDELLLKLGEKHGNSWVKIAEHFPTKDRTQVRHRYNTIRAWRYKYPDAPLSDAPSRVYYPLQYKEFQRQWEKAKTILKCGTLAEMVTAKHNLVSTLSKRKKTSLEAPKKKKPSVIETDLINYFRCSYDIPGGRKLLMRTGEAPESADELATLLRLLEAKLNLPSPKELLNDSRKTSIEKDILIAYMEREIDPEVLTEEWGPAEHDTHQLFNEERETHLKPVCEIQPSVSLPEVATTNIDYVPRGDLASVYTDLPLMNFEQDEVVVDRNRYSTFLKPPVLESPVLEQNISESSTLQSKEEYILPPNLSTLIGLRTFLLNRRNLVTWCTESARDNCVVESNELLEEAKKKFDQRLRCLFLWPALMSRYAPASRDSIFLDEEDKCDPKIKKSSGIRLQKTSSQVSDIQELEAIAGPSRSSPPKKRKVCAKQNNEGPPKKRLKNICSEDPNEDPDDPDSMN